MPRRYGSAASAVGIGTSSRPSAAGDAAILRVPATTVAKAAVACGAAYLAASFALRKLRHRDLTRFDVPAYTWEVRDRARKDEALYSARAQARQIQTHAERLDRMSVVTELLDEGRSRRNAIHNILASLDGKALNFVCVEVNLALVFAVARRDTLRLVCRDRLPELGFVARAAALDALQKVGLRGALSQRQGLAAGILLDTHGEDLTRLKALIDDGGDYHSLFKLVYYDLSGFAGLQERVLTHFRIEADELDESDAGSGDEAPPRRAGRNVPTGAASPGVRSLLADTDDESPRHGRGEPRSPAGSSMNRIKILCDVDDTLLCSGGSFMAGSDRRLPKHSIYPGVLALLREMDAGSACPSDDMQCFVRLPSGEYHIVQPKSDTETVLEFIHRVARAHSLGPAERQLLLVRAGDDALCDLAFLTARPHAIKDYIESVTYNMFRNLVSEGKMHQMPTLLPGNISAGMEAVVGVLWQKATRAAAVPAAWRSAARAKFDSARRYCMLYPEYSFVFVGDNGQGDLWAAEEMAMNEETKEGMRCALIHEVVRRKYALTHFTAMSMREREQKWRELGIYFFRSYVGAATIACRKGIISPDGLRRVFHATRRELDDYRVDHALWTTADGWKAMYTQLQRDTADADELLQEQSSAADARLAMPQQRMVLMRQPTYGDAPQPVSSYDTPDSDAVSDGEDELTLPPMPATIPARDNSLVAEVEDSTERHSLVRAASREPAPQNFSTDEDMWSTLAPPLLVFLSVCCAVAAVALHLRSHPT